MEKSRTTTKPTDAEGKDEEGGARGAVVALPRAGSQDRLRLEPDGQTHRRDCECARCEAGFTPTEREREHAKRRVAEKQGRLMAARAAERKREKARLAQTELLAYFRLGNAAADAEVQRLRASRAKAVADRRVDELLRLRTQGWALGAALEEIDRRLPPEGGGGAENDNASGGEQQGGARRQRTRVSGDLFS